MQQHRGFYLVEIEPSLLERERCQIKSQL